MEVDESPPLAMNGAAEDRHTLYINNLHEKVSQDGMWEAMLSLPYNPPSNFLF